MNKLPAIDRMLAQLVATPSVSSVNSAFDSGNLRVTELLATWAESLGFTCEIMRLPGHANKANLIATLGRGDGGLVLSGHTDTVPFDEGRWSHDPFKLVERDQRLYGLGSSDMKCFFALALEAVQTLAPRAQDLKAPLILLATADEESSMDGAKELINQGRPKARYAVIGEPTGLRPVRMHKGIMMEAIRLRGRSGHSSDPALGRSALEGMHAALAALLQWRDRLQQQHRNDAFAVPVPTLNLGRIEGGDNPNRICSHCELQIDLRPLPGMDLNELRADLRRQLQPVAAARELALEIEPLFEGAPAFETPADSELVRSAEKLTGHSAEAVAFATEAPYFQQLGMEPIVLGAGDIDQAHQPDEYLRLDRIDPAVNILRSLIEHHCLQTS